MSAIQRFWDAKWQAYQAANPSVAERPSWLKPSVTPDQHKREAPLRKVCAMRGLWRDAV